jgi:hypothetical protein
MKISKNETVVFDISKSSLLARIYARTEIGRAPKMIIFVSAKKFGSAKG